MARLAIPAQFRTESNVQAHIDVFLAEGPGEQDAWLIALLRGYVDMNAFLDKAVRWDGAILDPLFISQRESPFGFTYSAWAARGCARRHSAQRL